MSSFDLAGFTSASKEEKNEILDQLRDSGQLLSLFAELLGRIPVDKPLLYLCGHGAYQSIVYALKRQDWVLFRPVVRRFVDDLIGFPKEQEVQLDLNKLLEEYGLKKPKKVQDLTDIICRETIANGGPSIWQQVIALANLARILPDLSDDAIEAEPLYAVALENMLSSRRLLKVVHIWDEVWKRIPLVDSDMYYHDSRLRRAILDRNIDHAFRLVAASIKSGLSAEEVVGHFFKSMYDIDFAEPQQMMIVPIGLQSLLNQGWDPRSQEFQHAMARFVYDVMHFERTEKERLEYEQISLIKSREILIDFRRSFLQSVFLQAWGIAEYAFVHGFEANEVLDEVYRVAAAIGEDEEQNQAALSLLFATSELIEKLDEEYALYLLAYAVRYLVRQPKVQGMLDPFPDEME